MADTTNEGLQERLPLLKVDTPDDVLVKQIDKSIQSGKRLYEDTQLRARVNRRYWKGEQLDRSKMKDYQAKIVNNIVFRDMETMVPIITKETPAVKFVSSNKEFDDKIEDIMTNRWEVADNMLSKNRRALRANFLDLLGILKVRWDTTINDYVWEQVKTANVIIDPVCTDEENCGFVA